ncbi:MAG: DUF4215 domain-containing protein [Myxococcaceae bacterium]
MSLVVLRPAARHGLVVFTVALAALALADCSAPRPATPKCGDGTVDPGEVCDDGNTSSGDGCSATCTSTERCGDGVVNADFGKGADDPACRSATATGTGCKEVCDDGNTVSGDGCSANCLSDERCRNGIVDAAGAEQCDDGNQVDTDSCRNDCHAGYGCGNGVVDNDGAGPGFDESCDNGTTSDSAACDHDCTTPVCGDGVVNAAANESCDPGTVGRNVDSCNSDCTVAACGDGKINRAFTPPGATSPEACDDGNATDGDGCSAHCQIETCGDGATNTANGEQCDDGNRVDTDGCRNNCQLPRCGDGLTSATEACDDGTNTATCDFDCSVPACGDGKVNRAFTPNGATSPEECDDGNTTAGDGCSTLCHIETCGDALTQAANGEQCDDGNRVDTDGCRNSCQLPRCGDGVASASETCDTGGNSATCNLDCSTPACGDGKLNPQFTPAGGSATEQCDDGNTAPGDGCSALCQRENCGDGVTDAASGEQCDDGNRVDSDACRNNCQLPACGDGVKSASETCDTNGNSQTCNADCTTPSCGDGKVNPQFIPPTAPGPEQCDDGNTSNGDACSKLCQLEPYALAVSKNGTGTGSVDSSPSGITCGTDCTEIYPPNTVVTLNATAGANSVFTGWSGSGCTGTSPCVVTMSTAHTVAANFELNALTVVRAGAGGGTVTGTGITCGVDCSEVYAAGTMVTLNASADAVSTFTGWSGGGCSGTGACVVTMNAATTVTATFAITSNSLSVSRTGTGTGTVTSVPSGITCGATCNASFPATALVTLTATPGTNSVFTGWSGACTGLTTCTVDMGASRSVTANFDADVRPLTVSLVGTGGGAVSSNPAGIFCLSGNCTANFTVGSLVQLSAAANATSNFSGWSGGGCVGTGTCLVPLNAATTVTATFTLKNFNLSVSGAGAGGGTVSSVPAGMNCTSTAGTVSGTCSQAYASGSLVGLFAAPNSHSTFASWSGACTGTSPVCSVTVTAAATATANFALNSYLVTVTKTGGGAGTVTSTPAAGGINCGTTCAANFTDGTNVTLTAAASIGSTFAGWSGAGCSGTGTCVLPSLAAAANVSAQFNITTFPLTVTRVGNGTVTSNPSGINCGGTCAANFPMNDVVVLTAVPGGGSMFLGWSGGCSGTGQCIVTMSAAASVTATFNP